MAGAALSGAEGHAMAQPKQEFYLLRKYALRNGPQLALTQNFFEHALIPALNRMSITPAFYLLIPAPSVETLVTLNKRLAEDTEFSKAAAAFWGAPASSPPFQRVE